MYVYYILYFIYIYVCIYACVEFVKTKMLCETFFEKIIKINLI